MVATKNINKTSIHPSNYLFTADNLITTRQPWVAKKSIHYYLHQLKNDDFTSLIKDEKRGGC